MRNTPVDYQLAKNIIEGSGISKIGTASIRELVKVVNLIEEKSGLKFIRMEMGVPGLEPAEIAIKAEIEALRNGVASKYPMIEGVQVLKNEISRFIKLFLNVNVNPEGCIPTVGSVMGSMAAFLIGNRTDRNKEGTLFLDPGFPVHKQQSLFLGHPYRSFDIFDYRGDKLKRKLESYLESGKVSTILYSNPNNPSWICLTENELEIIGQLAEKYDVIVIEDLAYFAMDFRVDMSVPGKAPFQPTVAKFTDKYIILISSSKCFSYAGQRVGMMVVSDKVFHRSFPDLKRYFTSDKFGHSLIFGALYALSAGVCHSAQYGLAAILKAVNDGRYNFVNTVREYGRMARMMKDLFLKYGFHIVYDKDLDIPVADGFYFTVAYPGFNGADLIEELLFYGVSAISLDITGSKRTEGIRACVSQVSEDQMPVLEERLKRFNKDHAVKENNFK